MPQCVVVAGGLGSRLIAAGISSPKLLLDVDRKSLLSTIVEEIVREGYTKILFCLGFGSEQIVSAINALEVPIQIEISVEKSQLGTLGALENARDLLDDFFTVLMGDTYLSCTNIGSIHSLCETLGIKALTLCKFTDHPFDSDLVEIDEYGKILRIFRSKSSELEFKVNVSLAGVSFLAKELINANHSTSSRDITRNLFMEANSRDLEVQTLFHQGVIRDLGTPERYQTFEVTQGSLSPTSITNFKHTILLDRDGTLNEANGHISELKDIRIQPTGLQIAKLINEQHFQAFLITNQPVISHGKASVEGVREICSTLLKQLDIWQGENHIYVCPHYPESGFDGEMLELKIQCNCRKPMPGLLIQAANEHKFRLTNATMIGDSLADVYAGLHVGARVIHIHNDLQEKCKLDAPFGQLVTCVSALDITPALAKLGNTL